MMSDLIPLTLLGAVIGLDTVSFPQMMLSRPLVAATLGGGMVGAPLEGLLIGAALELIAHETLPFGASRYPEWGSASVVAGALFAGFPMHPAGSMTIALLAALATAWVGGWTMVKLRQLNARWATRAREALDAGARGTIIGLQLRGLTADLARGALLTAVALAVFVPLGERSVALWTVDARVSRGVDVAVATSVAVAATWKLFHGNAGARWTFAAGLGIGLMVVIAR